MLSSLEDLKNKTKLEIKNGKVKDLRRYVTIEDLVAYYPKLEDELKKDKPSILKIIRDMASEVLIISKDILPLPEDVIIKDKVIKCLGYLGDCEANNLKALTFYDIDSVMDKLDKKYQE